jgi:hypothetical protein
MFALLRLASRVNLGAEIGSSRARLGEVAGEDRLEEGAEDDLSAGSLGKRHPEDQNKLEGVVEGEPVHGADSALEDRQEGIDNPVRKPLSVIDLAGGEQSVQGVVAGDDESSNVDKELASNVEEDEEEVEAGETEDSVGLGDGGLLLEVVEGGVLGELDDGAVSEEPSVIRERSEQ